MSAKKVITFILKLAVTCLVFWWIDRSFGFPKIFQTLIKANFFWFAVAIFAHVISIFIGAWQWGIILKNRGLHLSKFEIIKLYFMGMFFNNFVLGTIAGDSFKVAVLRKEKKKTKPGFAATFLDRFAGLAVLSVFAVIGAIIINTINFANSKDLLITMFIMFFFALILILVFFLIFSKRVQIFFSNLLLKFPNFDIAKKIEGIVSSIYIDRRNVADSKMLAQIFALSFLIQGLRISTHIFCAAAIGIFAFGTIHYFFVIIPITAILMMIPLPFGVIPTIAGAIFFAAGFNASDATIMEFLAAIAGIIGSLAGAVFFLIDNKSK
ncbi:MAG: flippase-like domain-containing protein [Chitinivibrionia bacterium]|nr:flippase-like domain-containing protein [Chitinivibrionia bacterium]